MLATLIQRYDKNHFISRTRDKLNFYRLSGATCYMYDCINTIYQFSKPFFENKMSIFEEYGALRYYSCPRDYHRPIKSNRARLYEIQVTDIYNCAVLVTVTSECHVKRAKTWTETLANSADSDQMPRNAASDQGLHCFINYRELRVK